MLAHFFTMWGFFILLTVYIEAYGLLFQPNFHIPIIGRWDALGFLQDFFATAVFLGIATFAIIRLTRSPREIGRSSRFYGSHTGGAWLILFMIFNVIWTYVLVRGSAVNNGTLPYGKGAFLSQLFGAILRPLGHTGNEVLETVALLLHIGVMLAFLIIVLHSKHLHIFLAPINVMFKRLPDGLGPLLPVESDGKPIDFENPPDDAEFGRGKIEDFTWKGMLDFATCTECGRCQSQCPAWNTGKPLSPKLVIMDLRDHWMAKAPYLLGEKTAEPLEGLDLETVKEEGHHVPESGFGRVPGHGPEQAARPLVGTAEQGGVIDPDVLWSCVTCGACVEQCPVDIEHVDHIVDMRRYQVMMESEFPSELSVLFKNLETKGNPWGQNASDRTNWIDEVDFDVPVYGEDVDSFDGYEYLFWVGCAGAYDDKAKKTTKAVAELLAIAGVKYLVLGTGETCNGDSARRSGNEFLFQQLAQQAVETAGRTVRGRGDRRPQDRRHLPALLQHPRPGIPAAGRQLHRAAPHPAAQPAGARQEAGPRQPGLRRHHLSRPVLPGPAQQGVRGAARADRGRRREADRNAAPRRPQLLLRRGRRAHVDGRAHRQADQPRTRRRGAGHRGDHRRHRVPVLPGDGHRRRQRPPGRGRSQRRRGARRGPAAARVARPQHEHCRKRARPPKQAADAAAKAAPKAEAAPPQPSRPRQRPKRKPLHRHPIRPPKPSPDWVSPAAPSDPAPRKPQHQRNPQRPRPPRKPRLLLPPSRGWASPPAPSDPAPRRLQRQPNPRLPRNLRRNPNPQRLRKPRRRPRRPRGSASPPERNDPAPRKPLPLRNPRRRSQSPRRRRSRNPRTQPESTSTPEDKDGEHQSTGSAGQRTGHRARCPSTGKALIRGIRLIIIGQPWHHG